MKYVCIDPGKLTGLALIEYTQGEEPVLAEALELKQFDACDWIEDAMTNSTRVICEDFIISGRTAKMSTMDTRFSLEIIGFTRVMCKRKKIPLVLQTPKDMKTFFGSWSLHDFGLWAKGGEGHKRDATRHGVFYMLKSGIWDAPMEHTAQGDYSTLRKKYDFD